MLQTTLLLPTEQPPTLNEIKRLLLSYDRVILSDPGDRDLIPPHTYFSVRTGFPLITFSWGAVRPLGKVSGYDQDFEKLMEALAPARKDGLIDVVSMYRHRDPNEFGIGLVQMDGYPLDPRQVLNYYSMCASDNEILNQVLDKSSLKSLQDPRDWETVALSGVSDELATAKADAGEAASADEVNALTALARGRLATLVKFTGYCENQSIVPSYTNPGYATVVSSLTRKTQSALAASEDPYWLRRNQVLNLAFDMMMDESMISEMSIGDVLNLRTKEWAKYEEKRQNLFDGVFELLSEEGNEAHFEKYVKDRLRSILNDARAVEDQRERVNARLSYVLLGTAAAIGAGLASIPVSSALFSSVSAVQLPLATIVAALFGGLFKNVSTAQQWNLAMLELKQRERNAARGAGYSIHKFFHPFKK